MIVFFLRKQPPPFFIKLGSSSSSSSSEVDALTDEEENVPVFTPQSQKTPPSQKMSTLTGSHRQSPKKLKKQNGLSPVLGAAKSSPEESKVDEERGTEAARIIRAYRGDVQVDYTFHRVSASLHCRCCLSSLITSVLFQTEVCAM